jgi:hypothetical protein
VAEFSLRMTDPGPYHRFELELGKLQRSTKPIGVWGYSWFDVYAENLLDRLPVDNRGYRQLTNALAAADWLDLIAVVPDLSYAAENEHIGLTLIAEHGWVSPWYQQALTQRMQAEFDWRQDINDRALVSLAATLGNLRVAPIALDLPIDWAVVLGD